MICASLICCLINMGDVPPIIFYTGRPGGYPLFERLRAELNEVPKDVFSEPYVMIDGSVAFGDGGDRMVIFDRMYKPMRVLKAKQHLIRLMTDNGIFATYTYSKLPATLYDELDETFTRAYPSYFAPRDMLVHLDLNLMIEIKIKDQTILVDQTPPRMASDEQRAAMAKLPLFPMQKVDSARALSNMNHDRDLQQFPEVKLFMERGSNYATVFPDQRRILAKFDTWFQKASLETDSTIFRYVEPISRWRRALELARCSTFAELERSSPNDAASLVKVVLGRYREMGYLNSNSMRADLAFAKLSRSAAFTVSFALPNDEIGSVRYPSG